LKRTGDKDTVELNNRLLVHGVEVSEWSNAEELWSQKDIVEGNAIIWS
jgi:hypothetical protein